MPTYGASLALALWLSPLGCAGRTPAQSSTAPAREGDAAAEKPPVGQSETVAARSDCRSGRITLPEGGRLRAVHDEANGYVVLLPDLPDWAIACGEGPLLAGAALGGAVSVSVTRFVPEGERGPTRRSARERERAYLERYSKELLAELEAEGIRAESGGVSERPGGSFAVRIELRRELDGVATRQFNYLTTRLAPDGAFLDLLITVTARDDSDDPDGHEEIARVAEDLTTYLDLFRLDAS